MKSNVCALSQDTASLSAILKEAERTAAYAQLGQKETRRLRLLAEELVSMLPALLSFSAGEFWIETDGTNFELRTELTPAEAMTSDKREKLLSISTTGKNAAAKGIMRRIFLAAQFMLLDYDDIVKKSSVAYDDAYAYLGVHTAPGAAFNSWSLGAFRKDAEAKKGEAWDELEKSIVANIADDVTVGVEGRKVSIVVKKQF